MNQNPLATMPPVVKNILIICVLTFFGTWVMENQFDFDVSQMLGLSYFSSENFEPYQFVTHIFMHGDFTHLLFNMFAFWMFGRILEQVWGSKRFFIYFIITGLGAAFLHTFVQWLEFSPIQKAVQLYIQNPNVNDFEMLVTEYFPGYYSQVYMKNIKLWADDPNNVLYAKQSIEFAHDLLNFKLSTITVGASGAVFGVLLAFGMLFPNTELMLLFPPIPIKAKYFVIGYGALELYLGFANNSDDNVAHFAHLGGMLFGFILIKLWQKDKKRFY
jgi:membrane associated rhomboid family serine protease